jgi:hypothetical protein
MRIWLPGGKGNLYFNVSYSVGKGQMNDVIDVLLVQFLLRRIGELNGFRGDTHTVVKCLLVNPTGRLDDATVAAITAVQQWMRRERPAVVVDGIVSTIRERGAPYYTKDAPYVILVLNDGMRQFYPKLWPRLQDVPGCPASIAAEVTDML